MNRTETAAHPDAAHAATDDAGRRRVIVERVQPEVDGGRFAIKRTVDDQVTVTVDMFADGHDLLAGVVKYRRAPRTPSRRPASAPEAPPASDLPWQEVPLTPVSNDAWTATFTLEELGTYEY